MPVHLPKLNIYNRSYGQIKISSSTKNMAIIFTILPNLVKFDLLMHTHTLRKFNFLMTFMPRAGILQCIYNDSAMIDMLNGK